MILQALYELAQNEGLMTDPDFEPKPVAWLVRVSEEGTLLGIEGTRQREGLKAFSLPRERVRTSGDRAFFLYDKAEYTLGLDPEEDEEKRRSPEKLAERSGLFKKRIRQCLEETQDDGVRAVYTFLEDVSTGRQTVSLPPKCAANDLFAFVYHPDLDRLVSDREEVRSYWQALRTPPASGDTEELRCLVSGEPCIPTDLVPSLKRVPGGTSSGVALVSYNKGAFESYGWKRNKNAPISRDAAEACTTALNRLLHPAYPDPNQPGQSLLRRHLRLSANTVVCYWCARTGTDDFSSSFVALMEANPDEVKEAYRSIWRGRPPDVEDPSAFYALTLSGAQGRAIVRDWFEAPVAKVVRNLAVHFADLDIVRNTPKPRDRELPPTFPFHILLESLAIRGSRNDIPAPMIRELIETALRGTPHPFSLLQRAIQRTRAEIGMTSWGDLERRDARAALIKAVLNRRRRFSDGNARYKEVQREMDPNNNNPGYLLGRLMAIIERIQQAALGDVNASVVDRFFSGASATPAAVFPRLLKNLRHHARKAKNDPQNAGTAVWLESQVDDVIAHLESFPPHLDLEQQGLFVIGYHHQRNWMWTKKEDRQTEQSHA